MTPLSLYRYSFQEELEADEYASETLIPSSCLNEWLNKNVKLSMATILDFSKELKIHAGIIVGRLQYIKRIKYSDFNKLRFRYKWCETN